MKKVFIDGKTGTTGLRIEERLSGRNDIEIISLSEELRKSSEARREMLNSADIVFLCLPDDAAREAVSMISNDNVVVIDASTSPDNIIVASTGVIGQPLDLTPISNSMKALAEGLSHDGSLSAAEGIMTTNTKVKEIAVSFTVGGKECKIGGIAKGSGMIHPNMATMLVFITTDCHISSEMLSKALSTDVKSTFNMVSVDGDTSTNDMVSVLANGMAGSAEITCEGEDFTEFMTALKG